MVAPDPDVQLPPWLSVELPPTAERLPLSLADRAGGERVTPGRVVLPRSTEGLNASDTINGGLIALAAEEAVLSLTPGDSLGFLGLRYLLAAPVGPVIVEARVSLFRRNGPAVAADQARARARYRARRRSQKRIPYDRIW
ncbi:hypothetical protein K8O92_22045 [Nocardia asteroides]|nr:hypothetical protein K8O92_22045 [Nocardia asteroides]